MRKRQNRPLLPASSKSFPRRASDCISCANQDRFTMSKMEVDKPNGPSKLPVVVSKPTPYTFDLGLLLASDPNPLVLTTRENLEDELAATARDGAQALLNQLLSTCPIASTPNGVLLSLPPIETSLPREKVRFPPPHPKPTSY